MLTRAISITLFLLAILLCLAGGLITLFFRHYRGTLIPHPSLFWLGGILLGLVGYILVRGGSSIENNQDLREHQRFVEDLQTNGEKIAVDLTACEVRGNDYTETVEVRHRMDLYPLDYRNISVTELVTRDIQKSVFIFRHDNPQTGQVEKFISPIIPKDDITLSFLLEAQRQTDLYVDKTDRSRYFFDLDFLAG